MYATAHLVRREGVEGINAFLHEHGAGNPWPTDASTFPETNPGRIVLRRTDIPPGGNSVRAYLDVLAPDATPLEEIRGALRAVAEDLGERRNPTVFRHGVVTIRFGVEGGLELLREQQLGTLAGTVEELLLEWRPAR